MKLINKTPYNELILAQEDMIYFRIVKEVNKKSNKYGGARQAWMKFSRNFHPTTGAFKIGICKKSAKCKLYDVTRKPEEWITKIELLRRFLQNPDLKIDDSNTI